MPSHATTCGVVTLFALATVALTGAASAATLWATNDGLDSSSCGSHATPCRSISQAIENAAPNDTIEVGAGRYGDISGDGTFSHSGDEHPQLLSQFRAPFDVNGCIICVTKPLQIFSAHGAAVTLIQGIAGSPYTNTVLIAHDGVTVGSDNAGFTITGGNAAGIAILHSTLTETGHSITIRGNRDIGDAVGFEFTGQDFQDRECPVEEACPPLPIHITDNTAEDNTVAGFSVQLNGFFSDAPLALQDNTARHGGVGFSLQPGGQNEFGDAVLAPTVSATGNVALGNTVGFDANSIGSMIGNTASGNRQAGFLIVPGGGRFEGNSAIGNAGPGMIVDFSSDGFDDGTTPKTFQSFARNNFFGNDRNRPKFLIYTAQFQSTGYNPGPGAHCGILNVGALGADYGPPHDFPVGHAPAQSLHATDAFWGAPTGPSPSGTGDASGGACDQNNGKTLATPFSRTDFSIATLGF
jgi:hypothetical protein